MDSFPLGDVLFVGLVISAVMILHDQWRLWTHSYRSASSGQESRRRN